MSSDSDSGWTTAGIVGLVLFIILVIIVIGSIIVYLGFKKRKQPQLQKIYFEGEEHVLSIPIDDPNYDPRENKRENFSFVEEDLDYGYDRQYT